MGNGSSTHVTGGHNVVIRALSMGNDDLVGSNVHISTPKGEHLNYDESRESFVVEKHPTEEIQQLSERKKLPTQWNIEKHGQHYAVKHSDKSLYLACQKDGKLTLVEDKTTPGASWNAPDSKPTLTRTQIQCIDHYLYLKPNDANEVTGVKTDPASWVITKVEDK